MKKSKLLAFVIPFLLFNQKLTMINADEQTAETDDGTTVIYNSSEIDGGIDLNGKITEITNEKTIEYYSSNQRQINETYPYQKVISLTFQTQNNNYYCAPASVRMLMKAIGKNYTQGQIALLIGTNTGGTSFGSTLLSGINAMAAGTGFSFNLVWHSASDVNGMKSKFMIAIVYGNPVVVNTVEGDNNKPFIFNGHAANNIRYHFGVVNGYKQSGEKYVYTDPAYGMYSGTSQTQDVTKANMSKACELRGYIW